MKGSWVTILVGAAFLGGAGASHAVDDATRQTLFRKLHGQETQEQDAEAKAHARKAWETDFDYELSAWHDETAPVLERRALKHSVEWFIKGPESYGYFNLVKLPRDPVKFISVAPQLPRGVNVFVPANAIDPSQEETLRRVGSRLGFRMAKVIDLKTGALLHYTNLERGLDAGRAGSFLYSVCVQVFGWAPGTQLGAICTGWVYID